MICRKALKFQCDRQNCRWFHFNFNPTDVRAPVIFPLNFSYRFLVRFAGRGSCSCQTRATNPRNWRRSKPTIRPAAGQPTCALYDVRSKSTTHPAAGQATFALHDVRGESTTHSAAGQPTCALYDVRSKSTTRPSAGQPTFALYDVHARG